MADGRFRDDLYFRLAVIPIAIPPLRDRREDILPIARMFLARFAGQRPDAPKTFAPGVETALVNHPWPGNVRELQNTIERGVILSPGDRLTLDALMLSHAAGTPMEPRGGTLQEVMDRAAAERIREVLRATGGRRQLAAEQLGVERTTLYRQMVRLGISD